MSSEADHTPVITRTDCARCGTEVHGLDGRYACPGCQWVNHYSDGYTELPVATDDLDFPNPLSTG